MTVPEPRTGREVHLRKPTLASVRESLQLGGSDVADAATFEQLKAETAKAASRLRPIALERHEDGPAKDGSEITNAVGEEDMRREVAQVIGSASPLDRLLYERHNQSCDDNWLIRAMIWLYLNDAGA
ncbi:hypothetical protein Slin14017_G109670 [Septoria linicola]|nr:hypothetical protein Slin14017_G109670 [Septoria linicola]